MNDRELTYGFGLKPLPDDTRDFQLGAAFDLPPLSDLPAEFELDPPFPIKDQGDSDFCTAFATCGMSELQEGIELSPEYSFALSKEISGDPDGYGQDLRTALKAHAKSGALPKADSPFSLTDHAASFLRRISNWPSELKVKAEPQMKGSFLAITGPYDSFDNIRAAIWKFRAEKRAVALGIEWSTSADQALVNSFGPGFGHAIYAIGWKMLYGRTVLVIVNSWGQRYGDLGRFYFSKGIVNHFANYYGAFMFVDITKDEYIRRITPRVNLTLFGILQKVKDVLLSLLKLVSTPDAAVEDANQDEPQPEPAPVVPEPAKTWDKDQVIRLIKLVAVQENLSGEMTDRLIKTIACESGFNTQAINKNPNGTADYGLCQYNDYWYIGPGRPIASIDVALNDPETCLRVMARAFKNGRARDWICYRNLYGLGGKVENQFLTSMSITIQGLIVFLLARFLNSAGYTIGNEQLTTFVEIAGQIVGVAMIWYGRYRKGDISLFGFRKPV